MRLYSPAKSPRVAKGGEDLRLPDSVVKHMPATRLSSSKSEAGTPVGILRCRLLARLALFQAHHRRVNLFVHDFLRPGPVDDAIAISIGLGLVEIVLADLLVIFQRRAARCDPWPAWV